MAISVKLPALGESVVEGTVSRWLVKEGDRVERDQPIVEITTDKVDTEIPAPEAGVIEKILVAEGETVPVGAELARIVPAAEAGAGAGPAAAAAPEAARAPEAAPAAAPAPAGAPAAPAPRPAPPAGSDATRATPVARRMAAEMGVDLGAVRGTGVGGRITKEDVQRHADETAAHGTAAEPAARGPAPAAAATAAPSAPRPLRPAPSAAPAPAPSGVVGLPEYLARLLPPRRPPYLTYQLQEGDRVIPMSPLRKLVAEHMVISKLVSPHVGTVAEVDMGGVVKVREQHKRAFREQHGYNLTYLPFVVSATVRALREFPQLNASVVDDTIVEKRDIHIGIAVETEKGLVVPVVRHADRLSLAGLAAAIEDISRRARDKKLSPDELRGGTFTVSNPGRTGNLYGFAIINQPQVGILRMGEIEKRPVVRAVGDEDAIVIRPIMYLALSYDHRAVDGAPANAFLHRVGELLEEAEFDL